MGLKPRFMFSVNGPVLKEVRSNGRFKTNRKNAMQLYEIQTVLQQIKYVTFWCYFD